MDNLKQLITHLQNADRYDHPTKEFSVIETHISYVILTGEYVYKIKKPLDLEFLNFSSLEKRLFYCQEEVRLNKKLAPEVYLGVIKISGDYTDPIINSTGHAIEYAVKMRQFSQSAIFDHLLSSQELTIDMIRETAQVMAEFHQVATPGLQDNPYGTYKQIHEPVVQNFDQIQPFLSESTDLAQLNAISVWADNEHLRLQHVFNERKKNGFIRECHGDAHLGNIALIDDKPVIFDCIEFNDSFRWTDTMADIGFLVMDLEDKQQPTLANQLISDYMQATCDFGGLNVLNYYKSYRAVVRAKIAQFQRMQATTEQAKQASWQHYKECMDLAMHYCTPKKPALVITHGLTATGKTSVAEYLVQHAGFIHISSDVVRKQLQGLTITNQSQTPVYEGIYSHDITEKVYSHLQDIAQVIIQAGYSVVVDATFIKQKHRQSFRQMADAHSVPFKILHTHADEAKILQWLAQRQQQTAQISEAREDIYQALKANLEALTEEEIGNTLALDVSAAEHLEEKLQHFLKQLAA